MAVRVAGTGVPKMNGLFGDITVSPAERKETRLAERRRKAHQAYASTADVWKHATYRFAINVFLPTHDRFLFEELSTAYEEYAAGGHGPKRSKRGHSPGCNRG
jgi:hypothetical protein